MPRPRGRQSDGGSCPHRTCHPRRDRGGPPIARRRLPKAHEYLVVSVREAARWPPRGGSPRASLWLYVVPPSRADGLCEQPRDPDDIANLAVLRMLEQDLLHPAVIGRLSGRRTRAAIAPPAGPTSSPAGPGWLQREPLALDSRASSTTPVASDSGPRPVEIAARRGRKPPVAAASARPYRCLPSTWRVRSGNLRAGAEGPGLRWATWYRADYEPARLRLGAARARPLDNALMLP
jgi:hypothetical protein